MFDTLDGAQFLDELLQSGGILKHHHEVAAEQSVVGVDVDRAQHESLILGDDACQVVHDTDIVAADHPQRDAVLRGSFPTPPGLHDSIAIATAQLGGVGTVLTVDLDTAVDGDESEDRVTVDGLTTTGQLVVESFQVTVDDQGVVCEV